MQGSFISALYMKEPAGTFRDGYVFRTPPDLAQAQADPDNGYWRCDLADHERLTWTDKVYELFGLPSGTEVERKSAVARYTEKSRKALERVRKFGLTRRYGFILDARIKPDGGASRWLRVLAVPLAADDGRLVALHGVKRGL